MSEIKRLSAAELDAIGKRASKATFDKAYVKGDPWKGYEVRNEGNGVVVAETSADSDAEFIAHAREDVPALLAEVSHLRAELERIANRTMSMHINAGSMVSVMRTIAREALADD